MSQSPLDYDEKLLKGESPSGHDGRKSVGRFFDFTGVYFTNRIPDDYRAMGFTWMICTLHPFSVKGKADVQPKVI